MKDRSLTGKGGDILVFLYDPRTNIITETDYTYLEELTGKNKALLMTYRSKGLKVLNINSYILRDNVTVAQRKQWYAKEKYHDEVWKFIYGSNEEYLISNYGRFKRVGKTKTVFLLPNQKKREGYLEIRVMYKGLRKKYKVSMLVGVHFVGAPKPGEVLRHKNGIITDDFSGNLEYISREKLGRITGALSKSKPVVQLDRETKEVLGEFRSAREAGRECYLSSQAILDNCNKKSKTSGGYLFMFLEDYERMYCSKSKPIIQLDKDTREVLGEFRSAKEAAKKCYVSP